MSSLLTIHQREGVIVVDFVGSRIHLDDVPEIQAALEGAILVAVAPHILIDLEQVEYLPTTALGMLVAVLIKVRRGGGQMRMANLSRNITKLMATVRLEKIFEIYDDAASAMRSFS